MSVDIHALSGAYAVDAVDEFERAQFERHLADCESCRAEVDSLREAAALIAETSAVTPPDSLRASVLAGIQTVRPLPPVLLTAAERKSSVRRVPALVAAAAVLIALGGAGATVWHPWSSDPTSSITEASDRQTFDTTYLGADVEVVRSKSLDQAMISTHDLPELQDGQTYALWLIHDDTYAYAGSMDGNARQVLLDGDAATATGAGITVEDTENPAEPNLDGAITVDFA